MKAVGKDALSHESCEDVQAIVRDHMAACDQPLLSTFQQQLDAGLYDQPQAQSATLFVSTTRPDGQVVDGNSSRINFYQSTLSQLQVPADFASVQVSRPAN